MTSPLMERPVAAAALAASSGALNVWAWTSAGQFATAQTGNSALMMVYLVTGDWEHFAFSAAAVLGFAVGTFFCGWAIRSALRRNKYYTTPILLFEALALVVMGALWVTGALVANDLTAHIYATIISVLAGAQANAFHKEVGKSYSNVAPTNLVQSTAAFLSLAVTTGSIGVGGTNEHRQNWVWTGRFAFTYSGFLLGAGSSALIAWRIGWHFKVLSGNAMAASGWMLFVPAALLLAMATWAYSWQRQRIDPDPAAA